MGLAYKPLEEFSSEPTNAETTEDRLIWLGLVGMLDAPRPEVKEAVKRCREAGIRPIMITGDHQLTAVSIAHQLGISASDDRVLIGQQLQQLTQSELEQEVKQVSVYARVHPNIS